MTVTNTTVTNTTVTDTTVTNTTGAHVASLSIHGDVDTFPPHAEVVRTMLASGRFGTLTTVTAAGRAEPGYPFGSLVAYSVLADGSPLLCISEMAEHTRNAHQDSRAGLLVTGLAADDDSDPLDRPRASLVGHLRRHDPSPDEIARHTAVHPGVTEYVDFPDFAWWRLEIGSARYVGGFGHMSWVSGAEVAAAEPDPVLADAHGAVAHMNADHADACLDMVRWLGGLPDAVAARVHSIDRHGLTLYADLPTVAPLATVRLAFAEAPLASADAVRSAVIELTHRARAAAEMRS